MAGFCGAAGGIEIVQGQVQEDSADGEKPAGQTEPCQRQTDRKEGEGVGDNRAAGE